MASKLLCFAGKNNAKHQQNLRNGDYGAPRRTPAYTTPLLLVEDEQSRERSTSSNHGASKNPPLSAAQCWSGGNHKQPLSSSTSRSSSSAAAVARTNSSKSKKKGGGAAAEGSWMQDESPPPLPPVLVFPETIDASGMSAIRMDDGGDGVPRVRSFNAATPPSPPLKLSIKTGSYISQQQQQQQAAFDPSSWGAFRSTSSSASSRRRGAAAAPASANEPNEDEGGFPTFSLAKTEEDLRQQTKKKPPHKNSKNVSSTSAAAAAANNIMHTSASTPGSRSTTITSDTIYTYDATSSNDSHNSNSLLRSPERRVVTELPAARPTKAAAAVVPPPLPPNEDLSSVSSSRGGYDDDDDLSDEEDDILRRSAEYGYVVHDDDYDDDAYTGPVDVDSLDDERADGVSVECECEYDEVRGVTRTTLVTAGAASINSSVGTPEIKRRPDPDDGGSPPTRLRNISSSTRNTSGGVGSSLASSRSPSVVEAGVEIVAESERLDAIVAAVDEKHHSPVVVAAADDGSAGAAQQQHRTPAKTADLLGLPEFRRLSDFRAASPTTTKRTTAPLLSPSRRDSPPVRRHKMVPVVRQTPPRPTQQQDATTLRREPRTSSSRTFEGCHPPQSSPPSVANRAPPPPMKHQSDNSSSRSSHPSASAATRAEPEGVVPSRLRGVGDDDDDDDEYLSDVPSKTEVKDRYLQACCILKAALIDPKKSTTTATALPDPQFLAGLLNGSASSKEVTPSLKEVRPTSSDARMPPRQQGKHHAAGAATDLQRKDSYGEAYSNFSSFFKTDVGASSVNSSAFNKYAFDIEDDGRKAKDGFAVLSVNVAGPALPYTLQRLLNDDTGKASAVSPLHMDEAPVNVSQTSSSLFNREDESPFKILGTEDGFIPTVLTPVLMEALRGFFPYAVAEENFLLKYALERDGDSMSTMMDKIRPCQHSIMCVETVDGHVFGSFCSTPWRMQSKWYGSGEAFLWRLKSPRMDWHSRPPKSYSNAGDNEIEIYPYTGQGDMIQYCTKHTIGVGGVHDWSNAKGGSPYRGEPAGVGLVIDGDLRGGETNSCTTFANPRLGDRSTRKNEYEIQALEVWTVTPCVTVEDAEEMEMRRLFHKEVSEG